MWEEDVCVFSECWRFYCEREVHYQLQSVVDVECRQSTFQSVI